VILLQTGYRFLGGPGGSSTSIIISFVAVIVGVALLILVAVLINRRNRIQTPADAERYSRSLFRRTARTYGLPQAHTDMLEELVRLCKVRQPTLVFTSPGLLDDTLRKGLHSLRAARGLSDEEREKRSAMIFQIKQIVERNARRGSSVKSTIFLKPGQVLTITPEGRSPFSSRLISNMKDFLTVSTPPGTAGAETRWMRGTPLTVYLWRENDAGYSFPSKVLGYDTVKGVSSVLIQHSRTIRREQRRRSRRREIMRACFYYPIRVVEVAEGRTIQKKAHVERSMRALGTVMDLSAGGCSVQTMNPFERGKLVMIEFDIQRAAAVRAFGKVGSVRRQKGRGGSMHVMFTRVTQQHLNRISEFVYDFGRPENPAPVRQRLPGRR
jgi:c-di-GMP-binding flagellar brake protein YcgR